MVGALGHGLPTSTPHHDGVEEGCLVEVQLGPLGLAEPLSFKDGSKPQTLTLN